MATFTILSGADDADFTDTFGPNPPDTLKVGTVTFLTASLLVYTTTSGHEVTLTGSFTGLISDPMGTVTSAMIDLGSDGDDDIEITGILNADVEELLASHNQFWQAVLGGGDTFKGTMSSSLTLPGDDNTGFAGTSLIGSNDLFDFTLTMTGGGDTLELIGDRTTVAGISYQGGSDTFEIDGTTDMEILLTGDASPFNPGTTLTGGNDFFYVSANSDQITVNGDSNGISSPASLIGGDDYFEYSGNSSVAAKFFGDTIATGSFTTVVGGDDELDVLSGVVEFYGETDLLRNFTTLIGGNDRATGADGDDEMYGDIQRVLISADASTVFEGGDDILNGQGGEDLLVGDFHRIQAGASIDAANFTFGNDTLRGGDDDDDLYGDYVIDETGTLSPLAGGNDRLFGGDGLDNLYGGGGDDYLEGGDGDDTLYGEQGNDILEGGAGADAIIGAFGSDTAAYTGSNAAVNVNLQAGTRSGGHATGDTFSNIENITGSAFADTLIGTGIGGNVLEGGAGGDFIDGGTGAGSIGSAFNPADTASYASSSAGVQVDLRLGTAMGGDAAGDTLVGIEYLIGSAHADELYGGNDDSILVGGDGADLLQGNLGDDILVGGLGADTLLGGTGLNDQANYSGSDIAINVGVNSGSVNTGGHAEGDVVEVENIVGSNFDDTIRGNSLVNTLLGGEGADTLIGGDNVDFLFGGAGNDYLIGGTGADTIDGGEGFDILSFVDVNASLGGTRVFIDLEIGQYSYSGNGPIGGETVTGIEQIIGTRFNDEMFGDEAANNFDGFIGNDTMSGRGGDDILNGFAGNDILNGGEDDDTLTGSTGIDRFVFDTLFFGEDTITDFGLNGGTSERMDMRGSTYSFADATISSINAGVDTLVNFGADARITLNGIDSATIDISDFIFV